MAKWHGIIGYVTTEESPKDSGIWIEKSTEISYSGDLVRNYIKYESSGNVNDNINISNSISIIADPFAFNNLQFIRYAEFMGSLWKVTNVEIQYPRLILTIGGVYNKTN